MRTIILTYPEFQSLPRGIKQMLLATESFYFGETEIHAVKTNVNMPKTGQPVLFPLATSPAKPADLQVAA